MHFHQALVDASFHDAFVEGPFKSPGNTVTMSMRMVSKVRGNFAESCVKRGIIGRW